MDYALKAFCCMARPASSRPVMEFQIATAASRSLGLCLPVSHHEAPPATPN